MVVPTFARPRLVARAVRSALAQEPAPLEVVVVVDGRDRETSASLEDIGDPRVRPVVPERRLGNAGARNLGVARCRGALVAFLDDDDLWLPGKLAAQLAALRASAAREPIVSCRIIARNEAGDHLWPRRAPRPGERLADYLFCRRTPLAGEGVVQTSTVLVRRELVERVRFDEDMRRYVDIDWLLRAAGEPGARLLFPADPRPFAVWSTDVARPRIGNATADGPYALAWARAHRDVLGERAYAAMLLTMVSDNMARGRRYRSFVPLLAEAVRHGRPSAVDAATHVANFALPMAAKRRIAAAAARLLRGGTR